MSGYSCRALDLARYAVGMCAEENSPISNLQLQKILYFLQTVYCFQTGGKLLFADEFYAWPYGPVIPCVYHRYSNFGGRTIDFDRDAQSPLQGEESAFVSAGIRILREKYPWDLVKVSHAKGAPWDLIYKNGEGSLEMIPNDLLISYYGARQNA